MTRDQGAIVTRVSDTGRGICIASIGSPILEKVYNNAMADFSRRLDSWAAMRPGELCFTYDGIANACDNPGIQRPPDRVVLNGHPRSPLRRALLCGAKNCAKSRAPLIGNENIVLLRPMGQFGLVSDLRDTASSAVAPPNVGITDADIIPPQPEDMPRDEVVPPNGPVATIGRLIFAIYAALSKVTA